MSAALTRSSRVGDPKSSTATESTPLRRNGHAEGAYGPETGLKASPARRCVATTNPQREESLLLTRVVPERTARTARIRRRDSNRDSRR